MKGPLSSLRPVYWRKSPQKDNNKNTKQQLQQKDITKECIPRSKASWPRGIPVSVWDPS